MGNKLLKNNDGMPNYYNYRQTNTMINNVNLLLKQNRSGLGFEIVLQSENLNYNQNDWKLSVVPAFINMFTLPDTYHVFLTLKNIFNIHENMKHFQKKMSFMELSTTPVQSVTPGQSECCICLNGTLSMMLPCYHSFCAKCTQDYIIDKEEKKCPICRNEFLVDSQTLNHQIFTIIDDEQTLINDLRDIILSEIKQKNPHQVNQIYKKLNRKEKIEDQKVQRSLTFYKV